MAAEKDVHELAMALEGTQAAAHFERTAFKAKTIYATLASDGSSLNLKLTPDEQAAVCLARPDAFAPVPNAWGAKGWTQVTLKAIHRDDLRQALMQAWLHAQGKTRRAPKP